MGGEVPKTQGFADLKEVRRIKVTSRDRIWAAPKIKVPLRGSP